MQWLMTKGINLFSSKELLAYMRASREGGWQEAPSPMDFCKIYQNWKKREIYWILINIKNYKHQKLFYSRDISTQYLKWLECKFGSEFFGYPPLEKFLMALMSACYMDVYALITYVKRSNPKFNRKGRNCHKVNDSKGCQFIQKTTLRSKSKQISYCFLYSFIFTWSYRQGQILKCYKQYLYLRQ